MSFVPVGSRPQEKCPQCWRFLKENVFAHEDHCFHGHCVSDWLKLFPSCPKCFKMIDTTSLLGYRKIIEKNEDDIDVFSNLPKSFNYVIAASVLIPIYTCIAHGDPSIIAVTATIGVSLLANAIVQ